MGHVINHVENSIRAISSAGRAPALQAGCRQFDPVIAHHQRKLQINLKAFFFLFFRDFVKIKIISGGKWQEINGI